jgi:hypothetical protein
MMPRHLRDRARHGGGRLAKIGLAVTVLVLGAAILTPAADAATGTGSTQTVTFSLLGELSVTAATLSPNLGSLTAGATALNQALGTVAVLDTLADSTPWTASVAATDCLPAGGGTQINASALSINPGSTFLPTGPSAGASTTFTEPSPDTTPGTTLSPAVEVATDTATTLNANDGAFVQTGTTLNIAAPAGAAVDAVYTCTLQYTITG